MAWLAKLQPHKGASETTLTQDCDITLSDFNPTRVRLKPLGVSKLAALAILQPHKGASETTGFSIGGEVSETSTPQGCV